MPVNMADLTWGLLFVKTAFEGKMLLPTDWKYLHYLRQGVRAMLHRIILVLTMIVGFAHFTFAEEVQASLSNGEQQSGVSNAAQVTLDIHWLKIPDGELGVFQNDKMKLPEKGANTILVNKLSYSLLKAVWSNKRSSILENTIPLKLPDGEEIKAPEASGLESYKATVSKDRQTIELRLVFQKFKVDKEGVYKVDKERVPEATVVIPLGSSLLIHTRQVTETRIFDSGLAGNSMDKFLGKTMDNSFRLNTILKPKYQSSI
jgi:hypothetical protein